MVFPNAEVYNKRLRLLFRCGLCALLREIKPVCVWCQCYAFGTAAKYLNYVHTHKHTRIHTYRIHIMCIKRFVHEDFTNRYLAVCGLIPAMKRQYRTQPRTTA